MSSPVDNLQRRLACTDLSQSYWVEAGAGTGKTTILIERLLNLIIQGKAGLDEIVAITFTEKAAAELKHRLREELEQRYRQLSGDKAALLRAALEEIEYASITTIHSFATGLLRERPVEAGLDPRFIILDPGEMQDLLEETWENWFLDELASEPPVLKKALYLGCTPSQLKNLALILYQERDLVQEGCCPDPPVAGSFAEQLTAALLDLKQLLPDCLDLEDRGAQHIQEIITAANEWLAIDDLLEQDHYLMHRFPDISPRGNQKNWSPAESCRRQKLICRQLGEHLNEARRQVAGKLVPGLVSWARKFTAAVEQVKQEKSALDFQDLLLKSRNLLRDSLPARAYFQQRYRYLLIDEFQDTDPLQVEIIFFLAENEPRAGCWQESIPVPGKLFIVGDPKQSIYRFRRADIEIYQEAKQIMRKHGRLIDITQNFRTLPPVIDWVNSVFDKLIIPQERYQPQYQPLFPYRPEREEPAVIMLAPPPGMEQYRAEQVRAAEAEALAGLIARAVGKWTVIDKCGSVRPLRYGDCALLFSTTVGLEHYQEALRRMQIPFRLEGGKRFFHQAEIAALKNLLRAIDNPYDQISVLSVLRDWGGLSDQQIFEHTTSGGTFNYLFFSGPATTPVENILALLAEMHHRRNSVSLVSLVQELLERTYFYQRLALKENSRQIAANLNKVLEIIRLWEWEHPLTLKGFIRWLDKVEKQDREEAESLIQEADSDAVLLLTIHRSKGLEFPAVFLANLGSSPGNREKFIADRLGGRFEVSLSKVLTSYGWEQAREREKLRQEAEKVRLLYVAATRARDYLVLPRYYGKRAEGFWKLLTPGIPSLPFPGCREIEAPSLTAVSGVSSRAAGQTEIEDRSKQVQALLELRASWHSKRSETLEAASQPAPYYSVSGMINLPGDRLESPAAIFNSGSGDGEQGAAFGSAFHQIMETVDFKLSSPAQLDEQINQAVFYWGLPETNELRQVTLWTLQHPVLERARQAGRVVREMPFVYQVRGRVVEGIIDLLFQEQNGLVIVDYKTDNVPWPPLEERFKHYRDQGLIYALALQEITRLPVKEIAFLFVRKKSVRLLDFANLKGQAEELLKMLLE